MGMTEYGNAKLGNWAAMALVAVIGRSSLRQQDGSRMSGLQACGQKASAKDRFLWTVQRRVVQSSIPTALANSPLSQSRSRPPDLSIVCLELNRFKPAIYTIQFKNLRDPTPVDP
jgi:hypothetical protein